MSDGEDDWSGDWEGEPPVFDDFPEYRGETAPRRRWLAVLMTLASPGLGHVYVGRFAIGVMTNTLFVLMISLFVLLWQRQKFFPLWPALVLMLGWLGLLGLVLRDVLEVRREEQPYVLRPVNHVVTYLAVGALTFWLPLGMTLNWTQDRLWGWVWSGDDAMYPTIASGDLLMIDRAIYRARDPAHGELVLVDPPDEAMFLARVIGVAGELVQIEDSRPFVVNAQLEQYTPDEALEGPGSDLSRHDLKYEIPRYDRSEEGDEPERWYVVATPPKETRGGRTKPQFLGANELFVLNDNRLSPIHASKGGETQTGRRVHRDWVVGRPLYVMLSRGEEGWRWERVGMRLR